MPDAYADILHDLFGPKVTGVILPVADYSAALLDDEREVIQHASAKRQQEFASGRHCARLALTQLGIHGFPLLPGTQREPLWPQDMVGSIAHCRDLAGAVVAKQAEVTALGLDIETIRPLRFDITRSICTPDEEVWLRQQPSQQHDTLALLIFSLKEAVFKCVYPWQGIRLGFQDCSLLPDLAGGEADIKFRRADIPPCMTLRFHITDTHLYASATFAA